MIIDLESTKTVYINLDEHIDKNNKILSMLNGFTNVVREPGIDIAQDPYSTVRRVSRAHRNAILNNDTGEPLIVLEDDCVRFHYRRYIDVPDQADIVFLGSWEHPNIIRINADFSKVTDIRGAHAILYLTKKGKDFMLRMIDDAIRDDLWHDHVFGTHLSQANAYVLNMPIFYQTSHKKESRVVHPSF